MAALEIHHRLPRRLLALHARTNDPELVSDDPLSVWAEWEAEAERYGVEPMTSREVLEETVEGSTVTIGFEEHRYVEHAGDWSRWGRLGGVATFTRYGADYFRLLGRRRWNRVGPEHLIEYRAGRSRPAQEVC